MTHCAAPCGGQRSVLFLCSLATSCLTSSLCGLNHNAKRWRRQLPFLCCAPVLMMMRPVGVTSPARLQAARPMAPNRQILTGAWAYLVKQILCYRHFAIWRWKTPGLQRSVRDRYTADEGSSATARGTAPRGKEAVLNGLSNRIVDSTGVPAFAKAHLSHPTGTPGYGAMELSFRRR